MQHPPQSTDIKSLTTYALPVNNAAITENGKPKTRSNSSRLRQQHQLERQEEEQQQNNEKEEQISALRLIADSIAQQRQDASRAIIFHPLIMGLTIIVIGLLIQNKDRFLRKLGFGAGRQAVSSLSLTIADYTLMAATISALLMGALAAVGYVTSGYLDVAEQTGTWAWLNSPTEAGTNSTSSSSSTGSKKENSKRRTDAGKEKEKEETDLVLITKYGDKIIGASVLRGSRITATSSSSSPATTTSSSSTITGQIRAWTVDQRYRHSGIGTGLLETAVRICRERKWSGPIFADNHAHSTRLLYPMFHRGDDKRERTAKDLLEEVKKSI